MIFLMLSMFGKMFMLLAQNDPKILYPSGNEMTKHQNMDKVSTHELVHQKHGLAHIFVSQNMTYKKRQ